MAAQLQYSLPPAFDLRQPGKIFVNDAPECYRILPSDSIVLMGMTLMGTIDMESWQQQLKQIPHAKWIFVDNSYDPVKLSDDGIAIVLGLIKECYPEARIFFLSSNCRHYLSPINGVVYFPYCFFNIYEPSDNRVRSRRMGCLNRNNTPHRPWLMHNLLSQGLIDQDRDVYSVCFTSPYDTTSYSDVAGWLGQSPEFNQIFRQYPPHMATHPDGAANDVFTVRHPAWHTAVTIITETEAGDLTMVTDKTIKGMISDCCWTAYMGESGYRLLEEFGFEPRFFSQHAQGTDVAPILEICRVLDTESRAMDYREQKLSQIKHNHDWYTGPYGPWFQLWNPKFQKYIFGS